MRGSRRPTANLRPGKPGGKAFAPLPSCRTVSSPSGNPISEAPGGRRLWAKRTALCFSEGSPLQAAVSQINSSVCKSEKKKKSRVSECARPAGALPQAFQRLVVHFFSLVACQVPHRQVVACHHVPLGAKQQGFEDEAPRVKQGRLLLPDPNSLQEHFLLREPGSGVGKRMGGAS